MEDDIFGCLVGEAHPLAVDFFYVLLSYMLDYQINKGIKPCKAVIPESTLPNIKSCATNPIDKLNKKEMWN